MSRSASTELGRTFLKHFPIAVSVTFIFVNIHTKAKISFAMQCKGQALDFESCTFVVDMALHVHVEWL